MIGDAADMIARLAALLPLRWFGDVTPVLSAVLAGLADGWAWLYTMLTYARLQTRIATATDSLLVTMCIGVGQGIATIFERV